MPSPGLLPSLHHPGQFFVGRPHRRKRNFLDSSESSGDCNPFESTTWRRRCCYGRGLSYFSQAKPPASKDQMLPFGSYDARCFVVRSSAVAFSPCHSPPDDERAERTGLEEGGVSRRRHLCLVLRQLADDRSLSTAERVDILVQLGQSGPLPGYCRDFRGRDSWMLPSVALKRGNSALFSVFASRLACLLVVSLLSCKNVIKPSSVMITDSPLLSDTGRSQAADSTGSYHFSRES